MRFVLAMLAGSLVSMSLFLLMQWLISGEPVAQPATPRSQILDFVRVQEQEQVRERRRELPDRPPAADRSPPKLNLAVQDSAPPPVPAARVAMPQIGIAPSFGTGPFLGGFALGGPGAEGDIVPIVRTQPQYPREALLNNIEGWVEVEFTIGADGAVRDAAVITAEPARIFDREAVRAVQRWKFKPRVIDGVAVERRARQVIEFKLGGP